MLELRWSLELMKLRRTDSWSASLAYIYKGLRAEGLNRMRSILHEGSNDEKIKKIFLCVSRQEPYSLIRKQYCRYYPAANIHTLRRYIRLRPGTISIFYHN